MFERFLRAFPSESKPQEAGELAGLSTFIEKDLGVPVPLELASFWRRCGTGYFGDRALYFFGCAAQSPRDSFSSWNTKDFWASVYPLAREGGPVFFAETCFGDQLGFRWEEGRCIFILFCVDTFDAFVVANNAEELFENVLGDLFSLIDEERHAAVQKKLGPLQTGMHYAPLVSPMVGGSGTADNFRFETPNVHFRTAIATFHSLQGASQ